MSDTVAASGAQDAGAGMAQYLAPAICIDSDHPDVIAYANEHAGEGGDVERAVRLYYAIRDGFLYDPYGVEVTDYGMKASTVLKRGAGFCITKAALLAACCRVIGIPARLGFADVRNHLATQKLLDQLGTDLFVYHGFAELFLEGKWVKATPAFNLSLCEKFKVKTLEFDGHEDSILQAYDQAGNRHMEYVRDRGSRADVPVAEILASFVETYPGVYDRPLEEADAGSFEREAASESAAD
jgi:transglutaminase-like putative cysteine protease